MTLVPSTSDFADMQVQTSRTSVFPSTPPALETFRTAVVQYANVSTWSTPGRSTFAYTEPSGAGVPGAVPPRTMMPAWSGVPAARTVGQLWPV